MILIIDHFDSFSHNLYQLIAPDHDEVIVRRCDNIEIDEIRNAAPQAIILSPGPRGPDDTGVTPSLLNTAFAANTPIIGVCLGFQAMASFWGARVQQAPEVVHGKTLTLSIPEHPLFSGMGTTLQVARYHSLAVYQVTLPPSVEILAEHDGMVMAAKDTTRPWLGLQFHPESFLTPEGGALMQNAFTWLRDTQP